MKNIKYIFLGNSKTCQEIGSYPNKTNDIWIKDTNQIFEKYSKSAGAGKYEQRNRVVGQDGNYYFIIQPNDVFYLVLANSEYPERYVFELIEEIQKENVPLLIDSQGQLNKVGKQTLKNLIDSYENPNDKIAQVNNDLNDVKISMKENVQKIMKNVDDVNVLDQKAIKIKENANIYKKDAQELKRLTCWQNCKWTIILSILVIGILLVIILPIALSGKKSDNTDTTPPKAGSPDPVNP
jgi:hypothetical protein